MFAAGEQQRGRSDFFGPAEAAHRQRIDEGLTILGCHGRGQISDDRARRDGIDANAFRRRFPRQRAGEPHDRSLGRGIWRRIHRTLQSALRGDVNDTALPACHHRRIDRLCHEEHALQVHGNDPVEFLFGIGFEWLANVYSCIVEQDVDRSELSRRLAGKGPPGPNIGDIERTVHGAPAQGADLGGGFVGLRIIVQMAKGNVRALCGERERRGAADPARATRDQSDFSRKLHAVLRSVLWRFSVLRQVAKSALAQSLRRPLVMHGGWGLFAS